MALHDGGITAMSVTDRDMLIAEELYNAYHAALKEVTPEGKVYTWAENSTEIDQLQWLAVAQHVEKLNKELRDCTYLEFGWRRLAGWKGSGWYYWDKIGSSCYGPYSTQRECLDALRKHRV
jgi:hypothetical protein